jgi:hypothetical protein
MPPAKGMSETRSPPKEEPPGQTGREFEEGEQLGEQAAPSTPLSTDGISEKVDSESLGNPVTSEADSVTAPIQTPKQDSGTPSSSEGEGAGSSDTLPLRDTVSADRLIGMLKKENAWLIREIINRQREGTTTGVVCTLPQGIGISNEEIAAYGQPPSVFLEELTARQWLWIDKTKPTRKLHSINYQGNQVPMVIIKLEIARTLGFSLSAVVAKS